MKNKNKKKIKLIDYLLALVFFVTALFSLIYFDRKDEYIYIDVSASRDTYWHYSGTNTWVSHKIKPGALVYDFAGKKIAEVISINKYPNSAEIKQDIFITLKVKALLNKRERNYSYRNKILLVGEEFNFNADNYYYQGNITDIYFNENEKLNKFETKTAKVKVEQSMIRNQIVETYRDRLANFIYEDQLLFKTLDFKSYPAKAVEVNQFGQRVLTQDPLNSDLEIIAEIPVICLKNKPNSCFYNQREPLIVGDVFPMFVEDIILDGTLLDIEIY